MKQHRSRKLGVAIFENLCGNRDRFQKDEKQKRGEQQEKISRRCFRSQNANLENILKTRDGRVPKREQTARKMPMTLAGSANLEKILKTH